MRTAVRVGRACTVLLIIIFDRRGAYVMSGNYTLPLFAGVPSMRILEEVRCNLTLKTLYPR